MSELAIAGRRLGSRLILGSGGFANHEILAQALEAYTSAYNESDLGGAKEELRILYLCGELNVRLGNVEAGLSWLSQGMRHEKLHQHPSWERMLRERYTAVRESPGVA